MTSIPNRLPYPSPQLTTLRSCLISDEENEPILRSYQTYTEPVLPRSGRAPSPPRSNYNHTTKLSSFNAFLHIVCVMAGTGILQLPFALKTGGWLAVVWIFISGFLVYHSGRFLNQCLYYDGLNRLSGLIDIGGAALGNPGRRLVEFTFGTLIIGASGLYLILAASNLKHLTLWLGWSHKEWVLVCALIGCIPFITFKTLKEASLLSLFGVITTVIMIIVIVSVAFNDFEHLESSGDSIAQPLGLPNYTWLSWSSLPLSLASISFSFGGNTVFPHVEKSMQNPKAFTKILRWAILFVTTLYVIMATVGYLAYGDKTVSPIFKNLQPSNAVTLALIMLTIHVLLTIPINLTSFALDAENSLGLTSSQLSYGQQAIYRIVFRICVSLATYTLAIFLPYFEHFLELLGALSTGTLVFILPPIFYVRLFGWRSCTLKDKCLVIFMSCTGISVLLIGTFQALIALSKDVFKHHI